LACRRRRPAPVKLALSCGFNVCSTAVRHRWRHQDTPHQEDDMTSDRTPRPRTARTARGLNMNHNESVLPAPRPMRGIGTNHNESVLPAPRPMRGIGINHNESVLPVPRPMRGITIHHNESGLRVG
jgi:hypothetical protein